MIDIVAKDSFSGVLGNFGNIMTGLNSVVNLLQKAFDSVVMPVINFGEQAAMTAARVDELRLVDEILANNAGIVSGTVDTLANSLREEGIQADIAYETIAQMIRANLDLADTTDLARVAQDAAVISGQNSSDTLDQIIYGITTLNPIVLRHAGIIVDLQQGYTAWAEANDRTVDSLTGAEKQQIALNLVLEQGEKITGAYTEAMTNAFKQIGSFERYINDIYLAVGEKFQPAFTEIVFTIADLLKWLGVAVDDGGAFSDTLQSWADTALVAAQKFHELVDGFITFADSNTNISDAFVKAIENVDWGEVSQTLADGMDKVDWTLIGQHIGSGLARALGIAGEQAGEVNWTNLIFQPIKAAGELLAGWFAGFWGIQVSNSLEQAISQWKSFFNGLWSWIRDWATGLAGSIADGFQAGFGDFTHFFQHPFEVALDAIKQFLGIASPSSVFFEIGQNIMLGLINGIAGMANLLLAAMNAVLQTILGPLQPVLDLLGIDLNVGTITLPTFPTSTGGGTTTGSTGVSAQTVTNNYYGTVYFMGAGEPGSYYDCPYPNPLMNSSSGTLSAPGF